LAVFTAIVFFLSLPQPVFLLEQRALSGDDPATRQVKSAAG
jgi:hypothetical protein